MISSSQFEMLVPTDLNKFWGSNIHHHLRLAKQYFKAVLQYKLQKSKLESLEIIEK